MSVPGRSLRARLARVLRGGKLARFQRDGTLARFQRDEQGAILVEFVVIFPALVILVLMGYEFFDAYKSYSRASKASYAVSDFVSRQEKITPAFVGTMHGLLDGLLPWLDGDKSMRLTSVVNKGGDYKVEWSVVSGAEYVAFAIGQDVPGPIRALLPDIADGSTVVLTETEVPHRPMVDFFNLADLRFSNKITARPRFWDRIELVAGTP